jgi:hypothetical protein
MKRLRDILEQERSPDRAKRLIRYMGRKERFKKDLPSYAIKRDGIRSLFPYEDKKFYDNQFPVHASLWEKQPEIDVPIHKIKTPQEDIVVKDVVKKLSGNDKNSSSMPYIVHHVKSDTYYLWDGNHRTSSAKLLKKPTIRAKVYSYNGD